MRHFLLTFFVLVVAHHASALPPPSAVESKRLIVQLGSNRYYEREAATKALQRLGKRALPALRIACAAKDAEVRKRARRLVEAIAPVKQDSWETAIWLDVDMKANVFIMPVQADTIVLPRLKREIIVLPPKQPAKK
jgi:hypothetical protein